MKQMVKILTGFTLAIVLVGAVCLLAIQYLDVIMRVMDAGRRALRLRRDECCDSECCLEDDSDLDDELGAEA